MKISLLLIAFGLLCVVEGFKWRGVDENGTPVIRVFTILKSPSQGYPHDIEWRTVERDVNVRKVKDAIQFRFSTDFFPHYVLRHFDSDSMSVEQRAARHGLRKIVEYQETTSVDGFDPDVDTIVQNYTLWNKTFTTMAKSSSTVSGSNVISVCTNTEDGVVELCMYFTDIRADLRVNGSAFRLDNNAIHHTLTIKNFPFISNTSRLALKVHFDGMDRVRDLVDPASTESNEGALNMATDSDDAKKIRPVAAWSTTVNVTGDGCAATAAVVKDVIRDVESSKDIDINFPSGDTDGVSINLERKITYFSFITNCPKPSEIYWDPELGVSDQESGVTMTTPSFLVFIVGVMFAIYAVAL